MYKARKKSFFPYLCLAVVMFLVAGFIYVYTDGYSISFQFFYLKHDSKVIFKQTNIEILKGETVNFDCKDTLKFWWPKSKQCSGFSVEVLASAEPAHNFKFFANGLEKEFNYIGSVAEAFEIVYFDACFSITLDKNMQEILESVFLTDLIELPDLDFSRSSYFNLIVNSKNLKYRVKVNLIIVGGGLNV